MPRISIGDSQLYYEREGDGFPVLFITGLAGYASFWRDQVPSFARNYTAITYDHRGVGQSDLKCASNVIERLAADAAALLDALGVTKAHIVGHSAGAAAAQVLAIEHAQRVASVVIVAGWTKPDAYFRRFFALRKELLSRLGPSSYIQANTLFLYPASYIAANNEKLRQIEAQNLAHFPSPDTIASRIDAIMAFDRTADLGKIRIPTLVLGAQDDVITPAYFSEELARRIPGAEAKFFPQGGHDFPQVVPREFNQAVLPFLQAHTPAT
ncbi:MAG TPA: alpha/beta fold hydrolase [Stellaceae bacterium]|jgi:aminoacrylate hydrolase